MICVHKNTDDGEMISNDGNGNSGDAGVDDSLPMLDTLVIDLSPLRMPNTFPDIAAACVEEFPGGTIQQPILLEGDEDNSTMKEEEEDNDQDDDESIDEGDDPWTSRPIYQLNPYRITWNLPRADAKKMAKELAVVFKTAEPNKGPSKKSRGLGAGKNRRSGGYGIG